ncbi:MAG: T9SS type A sorting domain-containing protein, partial [Bacteroidota bacterium]
SPTGSMAGLRVFPNPVRDRITATCTLDKPDEVAVSITDLSGRTVLQSDFSSRLAGRFDINLEPGDIPAGVYILTLISQKRGILRCEKMVVSKR